MDFNMCPKSNEPSKIDDLLYIGLTMFHWLYCTVLSPPKNTRFKVILAELRKCQLPLSDIVYGTHVTL